MLKFFKLNNGIHVAWYKMSSLKSVHIQLSAKGGGIMENELNSGVAHFMEHMIVQGIPSLPDPEKFSQYVEGLAGNYNAQTEKLLIGFTISLPANYLEDGLKIASEVFFQPLFVKEYLEKERQAVLTEILQRMDSHIYRISKFFAERRYKPKHPLVYDTGGNPEVIKKLERDNLTAFWQEYFFPKNTYILITGNFDDKKLRELLNNYFGKIESDKNFEGFPQMSNNDFAGRGVYIRADSKLNTAYIDFTYPSVSLKADLKTRVIQTLSTVILGRLRNSRLFKLLRYQRGLVYDVSAGAVLYPGLGFGFISAESSIENLDEVVELISKELEGFIKNGPLGQELDFSKNYLSNQWLMAFDHPSSISGWIESQLLWEKEILLPEDYSKMIEDISPKDLLEFMQKNWDLKKLQLTLQGPLSDSKESIEKYSRLIKDLV